MTSSGWLACSKCVYRVVKFNPFGISWGDSIACWDVLKGWSNLTTPAIVGGEMASLYIIRSWLNLITLVFPDVATSRFLMCLKEVWNPNISLSARWITRVIKGCPNLSPLSFFEGVKSIKFSHPVNWRSDQTLSCSLAVNWKYKPKEVRKWSLRKQVIKWGEMTFCVIKCNTLIILEFLRWFYEVLGV